MTNTFWMVMKLDEFKKLIHGRSCPLHVLAKLFVARMLVRDLIAVTC